MLVHRDAGLVTSASLLVRRVSGGLSLVLGLRGPIRLLLLPFNSSSLSGVGRSTFRSVREADCSEFRRLRLVRAALRHGLLQIPLLGQEVIFPRRTCLLFLERPSLGRILHESSIPILRREREA